LKKNKSIHQKVELSIKALGAQIVFYKALRGNGWRGEGAEISGPKILLVFVC